MEHACLILISGALQCISHPFRSLAVPYLTKEKHREKTHRKRANGILRYVFYAMLLSAQALPGNGFYGQVQPGLQNVYQGGGGGFRRVLSYGRIPARGRIRRLGTSLRN